jgi:hypothetical protein
MCKCDDNRRLSINNLHLSVHMVSTISIVLLAISIEKMMLQIRTYRTSFQSNNDQAIVTLFFMSVNVIPICRWLNNEANKILNDENLKVINLLGSER